MDTKILEALVELFDVEITIRAAPWNSLTRPHVVGAEVQGPGAGDFLRAFCPEDAEPGEWMGSSHPRLVGPKAGRIVPYRYWSFDWKGMPWRVIEDADDVKGNSHGN